METLTNGHGNASHILDKLQKVRRNGRGWKACCPAHNDRNPSLDIDIASDGKILVNCRSQKCSAKQIVESIGLTEAALFPKGIGARMEKAIIIKEYPYTDENGELLYQVLRKSDKTFPQRRPDITSIDGWNWSTKGVRRVLYRLPKVLDAVKRGLPVIITEGEKDVESLERHGFTATCNPGGACSGKANEGKWHDSFTETLRGADVVLCGDNDDAGREHVAYVLSKLKGVARSVKAIEVPKPSKDVTDFFSAGGTSEQLVSIIDRAKPARTFAEQVEDRRWDPNLTPPAIRPVYSIGAIPIATPGNLQTISAQAKTGKSAFINVMLAAPMALDGSDTFGVLSTNPGGKAVVHIDTEQSLEDFWHQVRRAIRRAGIENPPAWLVSYCLTGFDAKKARAALTMAAEKAAQQFSGVHSIHLDGVADLVCDVNDPEECNAFVAELHAFAIQYDCPITGVIHFNPGGDKTRGHLGSQLERKAETNLRLDKDGEVTEVWSEKQRRAPIVKGTGPRFKWSDEAGMHVSCETAVSVKSSAKIEQFIFERDLAFGNRPAMRYNELKSTLMEVLTVSPKTAERRIKDYRHFNLIENGAAQMLVRKDLK